MPTIIKKAHSHCTAERIFSVVNDIDRYPEFIEWCKKTEVLSATDTLIQARLDLKKGILQHSITTENTLAYPYSMSMRLLEGPFRQFVGEWKFQTLSSSFYKSEVAFYLQYEFSNRLLALTTGPIFHQLADDIVQKFLDRANSLYTKLKLE